MSIPWRAFGRFCALGYVLFPYLPETPIEPND
jgi:hypothetical protein